MKCFANLHQKKKKENLLILNKYLSKEAWNCRYNASLAYTYMYI